MRRSALTLARRLAGGHSEALAPAAPAVIAAACSSGSITSGSIGPAAHCSGAAAAAAAAAHTHWGARLFSAAATDTEEDDASGVDAALESLQRKERKSGAQRFHPRAPDPDSDLGRLGACSSEDAMRAWRAALEGEGRFAPEHVAMLLRTACTKDLPLQQRQAYLRELLHEAIDGQLPLDGRAAAYLLWGPARLNFQRRDPDAERVMSVVFEHVENMHANDLTTVLWACGILDLNPRDTDRELLLARVEPLLPSMRVKELTAAGVGMTRLHMPRSTAELLISAFEEKVQERQLQKDELLRIVRLLPHIPGLQASSPLVEAVFQGVLDKAKQLDLRTLGESVWAAAQIKYQLSDEEMQRMLSFFQGRLDENTGVQVQCLLHGLSTMACRAGRGAVTHKFLQSCFDSQLDQLEQDTGRQGRVRAQVGHAVKALVAMSTLRAKLSEESLQRLLGVLEGAGLELVDKPWKVKAAFRRLNFAPGVEALEPYVPAQPASQGDEQQQQHMGDEAQ